MQWHALARACRTARAARREILKKVLRVSESGWAAGAAQHSDDTEAMLPSLLTPAREAFCLAAAGLAPATARTHPGLDSDLKLVHVQNQLQTRKTSPHGPKRTA